ncbi:hypothetical protein H4R35_001993 [Dimargaris xerosporica]|nr:hypothetical protein H4R35_001993 [Dimargaris xerosporica]
MNDYFNEHARHFKALAQCHAKLQLAARMGPGAVNDPLVKMHPRRPRPHPGFPHGPGMPGPDPRFAHRPDGPMPGEHRRHRHVHPSGKPRPFRPHDGHAPPASSTLIYGKHPPQMLRTWSPVLVLDPTLMAEDNVNNHILSSFRGPPPREDGIRIPLVTRDVRSGPPGPVFHLDREYAITGALRRSYYLVMEYNNVPYQFVFDFPDHAWFHDLYGLRKTAYVTIRAENSSELWDLHLKPSRDKSNLFGYIYRRSELKRIILNQQQSLLNHRRLPLVFDLDDTLVRVVANNDPRYVPEHEAAKVPHRVRKLEDGRRVVLADRVQEFIEWAHNYFEISVCSLGDPQYVKMVVSVLDPHHTWIKGILYSARQEYNHHIALSNRHKPPKDLLSLYAFCTLTPEEYRCAMYPNAGVDTLPRRSSDRWGSAFGRGSNISTTALTFPMPLIIDDMSNMWPTEQQDNIIYVRDRKNVGVWDVPLYPHIHNVLQFVHSEFFRQYDLHLRNPREHPDLPSAPKSYKEYLRGMFRDQIGSTPSLPLSRPYSSLSTTLNDSSGVSSGPPPHGTAAYATNGKAPRTGNSRATAQDAYSTEPTANATTSASDSSRPIAGQTNGSERRRNGGDYGHAGGSSPVQPGLPPNYRGNGGGGSSSMWSPSTTMMTNHPHP